MGFNQYPIVHRKASNRKKLVFEVVFLQKCSSGQRITSVILSMFRVPGGGDVQLRLTIFFCPTLGAKSVLITIFTLI